MPVEKEIIPAKKVDAPNHAVAAGRFIDVSEERNDVT